MKRFFLILAITALTLSCYRREDFHECDTVDLDNRVTELEGARIPSIESQIANINASISDLESLSNALKEQIAELEKSDEATAEEITLLKQKDAELELMIENLTNYVLYLNESTIDWVQATFATINQFNALSKELANLKTLIESYKNSANTNLSNAISNLNASMKKWVNEQLANYYTIAEIDAMLADIERKINIGTNYEYAEEIENLKTSLQTLKSELTTAYKDAIKKAIEDNNGVIDNKIANAIVNINSRIDNEVNILRTDISLLAQRMGIVEGKIATIEEQIANINASISALQQLSQQLKNAIAALQQSGGGTVDLTELKEKDAELEQMIATLRQYVNSELAGMEDWANATFATLGQYEAVLTELAALRQIINNYDAIIDDKLNLAISQAENSMRNWVNAQLANYYTIAEVEAKLAALQNQINTSTSTALAQEIEELKAALATMKSEITAAYTTAINKAINDNNGVIDQKIASAIASANADVNDQISALGNRVTTLEKRLSLVEGKVATIEEQIANINTTINNLTKANDELDEYISNLQVTAQNLQKAIDDTNSKIDAVEDALSEEIGQAKAEVLAQLTALRSTLLNELSQINNAIAALQAKDAQLEAEISDLRNYISNELNATKDWANATFVTLDRFNQLATEVATIKAQILAINDSIVDLEQRLNNKIANDIATAVATLNNEIQQKVSEVTAAYTSAISKAKSDITAAYTSAINEAIASLENSLKSWVNNQLTDYYTIAEVEAKLAALENRLYNELNAQKAYLEGLINTLSNEVKSSISNNTTLIEALSEQLATFKHSTLNAIYSHAESINTLSQEIVNNSQQIASLQSTINALAAEITRYNAEMNTKIAALEAALNNGGSNTINQKIEELRNDYNSKILALQTEMQNKVNEINALIKANADNIKANQQAVAANAKAIQDLGADIDADLRQLASDIAKNAANIATQAAMIAENATAINNNAQAISKNVADILKLQQDMVQMQSDITAAYKEAINKAINDLEGQFDEALATEVADLNTLINSKVAAINSSIDALTSRVDTLEQEVDNIKTQMADMLQDIADIKQQISDLMKKIQSVTYIPKYSDGKATVTMNIGIDEGVTEFDFQISPKDVVADIASNWQSVLAVKSVYTLTRAVTFVDMPILTFSADESNGVISISVSGENLSEAFFAGSQSASASLAISDGINSVTSDYIEMVPLKRFKIEYTATAILNPFNEAALGANIIENHFDKSTGKGYLILDDAVSIIGEKAFYNCNELVSITLPNYVTTIGTSAFEGCDSLSKVVLPESVTTIEASAFYDCSKLTEVTLGNNIKVIKANAFDNCPSLAKIYVKRITPAVADYTMFLQNASGRKIYVPAESLLDYRTAEGWKYYASDIVGYDFATGQEVASGPTNVEIYYTSTNGKTITINSGADFGANLVSNSYNGTVGVLQFDGEVTTLGAYAFNSCTTLATITLPNSLTSIGAYAFASCSGLKSITIPSSVDSIGNCAFRGCTKLSAFYGKYAHSDNKCLIIDGVLHSFAAGCGVANYTIPSNVTKIGMSAFYNTTSLTTVTIHEDVTTISDDVFYNCKNLKTVFCKRVTPPTAEGTYIFDNNASDRKIYVPTASVATYKSATNWDKYADYIFGYDFDDNSGITGTPTTSEIWYTTTDGLVLTPYATNAFGANILSNTYENGKGVIKFDGEVTKIGFKAFQSCNRLKEIIIPNSVTSIGEYAFYSCKELTKIDIPNKVTSIGGYAFHGCNALTNVTLGNSIKSIGSYAIAYCSKLTNITIPNSVTSIGASAFTGCSGLTTITIAESVTSIGASAFSGCTKLTSVYCKATTPPAGGGNMFDDNATDRKIYVPNEVVETYRNTLHWMDYAQYIVGYDFDNDTPPNNEIWYTTTDGNVVTPYKTDGFGANIVSNTYQNGKGVIEFDGPVTKIGASAFYNLAKLESITLPNKISSIEEEAFYYCIKLKDMLLPQNLETIAYHAFARCSSLEYVTIPESVITIEESAFYCSNSIKAFYGKFATSDNKCLIVDNVLHKFANNCDMVEYTIPNGVERIGNGAFRETLISNTIHIPDSVTSIGPDAFWGSKKLQSISIPNSVLEIGAYSFATCEGLVNVELGNGITTIEKSLFEGCSLLSGIDIPEGVQTIGTRAFYACYSMKKISLPTSLTSIEGYAFEPYSKSGAFSTRSLYIKNLSTYCKIYFKDEGSAIHASDIYINDNKVDSIDIPSDITKLKAYAFFMFKLEHITIPENVIEIEPFTFYHSSIKNVTFKGENTTIGRYSFGYCNELESITLPQNLKTINSCTFYYCTQLTNITIPNSVTAIYNSAFYNNGLTSITIPENVTSIESNAFLSCSKLAEVYCKATTPPTGGASMFDGNATNRIIYVPTSSVDSYKAADGWEHYSSKIKGYDFTTSEENYKIIYTSTDGNVVTPYKTEGFGANILSNTYKNGQGVITFDGEVTAIAYEGFKFCANIQTVTLPSSISVIDGDAFYNCTSLHSVYCSSTTPPDCRYGAFGGNAANRKIYVPTSSVDSYKNAGEYWSDYASAIVGYDF